MEDKLIIIHKDKIDAQNKYAHERLMDVLNSEETSKKFQPRWDNEPNRNELLSIKEAIYVYLHYTELEEINEITICKYTNDYENDVGYNKKIRVLSSKRYTDYIFNELRLSLDYDFPHKAYVKIEHNIELYERVNEFIYYNYIYKAPNGQQDRLYQSEQNDLDLICSSKAFRRLQDKAQIFTSSKGDHYRTRLTHTIEVCNISERIAKEIQPNICEVVRTIAMAHDIGHTPFGHQGERTLDKIIEGNGIHLIKTAGKRLYDDIGGFKHNIQSVRILTRLENNNISYKGLNISYEVLEGIIKHSDYIKYNSYKIIDDRYRDKLNLDKGENSYISGKIVAIADEIAQRSADIEDAILSNILNINSFFKILDIDEFRHLRNDIENRIQSVGLPHIDKLNIEIKIIQEELQNYFVNNIINEYKYNNMINFDRQAQRLNDIIENMIKNKVLMSAEVSNFDNNGKEIVKSLFEFYYNNPQLLNDNTIRSIYLDMMESETCWLYAIDFRNMNKELINDEISLFNNLCFNENGELYIDSSQIIVNIDNDNDKEKIINDKIKGCGGLEVIYDKQKIIIRNICDYIAGMTDSFAISEYKSKILKI